MGEILHENDAKQLLVSGISNPEIDEYYESKQ